MSSDADNIELAERFANQDATTAAATKEIAAALPDPVPVESVESVELDPSDLAGFTANSPSIRHMLNKIDALEAGIVELHDAEHSGPIQWCSIPLCQTLENWR